MLLERPWHHYRWQQHLRRLFQQQWDRQPLLTAPSIFHPLSPLIPIPLSNSPTLQTQYGFVIHGETDNHYSGSSVSSAGDVNGDGLADLIIGAPESSFFSNGTGHSYVVFGTTDTTAIELSDVAAGSGGFVIHGQSKEDFSGISLSSAGDINGDGPISSLAHTALIPTAAVPAAPMSSLAPQIQQQSNSPILQAAPVASSSTAKPLTTRAAGPSVCW